MSLQGSDTTGDGSPTSPWRTIQKAVNHLQTFGVNGPTTIHVSPGTPSFGVFAENVTVSAIPGTSASNTVTIQVASGKFVRVDNTVSNTPAFKLAGCTFVTLKGFEVSTPAGAHGIVFSGSTTLNCTLTGLNIHDITGASKAGVRFESGATGNVVEKSVISGKTYGVWVDTSDGNTIRNSFVYGGTDYGIWVDKSANTLVYFCSLRSSPAGSPGNLIRFSPAAGDTGCEFKNLNFYLDSAGVGDFCFFASSTSAPWTGNFNSYFVVGSGNVGKWSGNTYTTLSAWQAAGHGQDANSISADPREVSAPNQRLVQGVPFVQNPLLGKGTAIPGITTDIDGNTRNSPPTIGAHESPLPPLVGSAGIVNPLPAVGKVWRSIVEAITEATARGISSDTTITVETGTYPGEHRVKAIPGAALATAEAPEVRLTFQEAVGNAAIIDGQNAANALVFDSATSVSFAGFEIRKTDKEGVVFLGSSKSCTLDLARVRDVGNTPGDFAAVRIDSQTNACKVRKSKIEGDAIGIHVNGAATDAEISNNWILGGTLRGVWLQGAEGAGVYFNSFRNTAAGSPDQLLRIEGGSSQKVNTIKNNILFHDSNQTLKYCIFVTSGTDPFDANGNCYFAPNGANVGSWAGVNRLTFTDWKNAGHSEDERSFSEDPRYISPTILNLSDSTHLVARGFAIPGITTDIDGDQRGYLPTVGSDEKPFPSLSGTVTLKPDGTGTFQSFRQLFSGLSTTEILGPVTVLVDGGTYIEEDTILVNAIPGSNPVHTVTVKPSGAGGAVVIKNTFTAAPVFTFDGGKNVILEDLTLAGDLSTGSGVELKNGATNNVFKKLKITTLTGTASMAGISLKSGSTRNTVTQCEIVGLGKAVEVDDSDDNVLSNNFLRGGTDQTVFINNSNKVKLFHNTLRSVATGTPPDLLKISPQSGDTANEIRNNIFYLDSTAAGNHCINISQAGIAFLADTNDYFIANAGKVGRIAATDYATLGAWKAAGHGQDQNSIDGNPLLTSATDPHLLSGSAAVARGTPLSSVAVDIDGDARSTLGPDIGADERPLGANQPPVASTAGSDTSKKVGSVVNLVGTSSSDPDSQPLALRFSWVQTQGPAVTITGATSSTASFTPTKVGTYVVRLTVNDGKASSTADATVLVTKDTASPPANNLVVGPGETHTTIQSAVIAATAGQVIGVKDTPGGYSEQVTVDKQLTIQRFTGHNPVLTGGGTLNNGFNIQASGVVLDGFQIENFKENGITGNASATGAFLQNLVVRNITGGTNPAAISKVQGTLKDSDVGVAPIGLLDTDNLTVQNSHLHSQTTAAVKDVGTFSVTQGSLIDNVPKAFSGTNTSVTVSGSTLKSISSVGFEGVTTLVLNQGTTLDGVATGAKTSTGVSATDVTIKNSTVAAFDGVNSLSLTTSDLNGGAVGVKGGTSLSLSRVCVLNFTQAAIQNASGTFNRLTVARNFIGFENVGGTLKNSVVWENTFPYKGSGTTKLTASRTISQNGVYDSFTQNPNVFDGGFLRNIDPKLTLLDSGDCTPFLDPSTPANTSPAVNAADPLEPVPPGGGARADLGAKEVPIPPGYNESLIPDPFFEEPVDDTAPAIITCELVDDAGNPIQQDASGRRIIGVRESDYWSSTFPEKARVRFRITIQGFHDKGLRVINCQKFGKQTNQSQNWVTGRVKFVDPVTGQLVDTVVFNGAHQDTTLYVEVRALDCMEVPETLCIAVIEHERANQFRCKAPYVAVECFFETATGQKLNRPTPEMLADDQPGGKCKLCICPPIQDVKVALTGILYPRNDQDGPPAQGSVIVNGVEITRNQQTELFRVLKDFLASADHPLRTDEKGCVEFVLRPGAYQARTGVLPSITGGVCEPWVIQCTHPGKDGAGQLGPYRKELKLGDCVSGQKPNDAPGSVHLFDGEEVVREFPISIAGRGMNFEVSPKYRSKVSNLRPFRTKELGNDWTVDCIEDRLIADNNHIVRLSPRGYGDIYREKTDQGEAGKFDAPQEFFTDIRKDPITGDITIHDFDGEECTYRSLTDPNIPGRLIRCEDKQDNFMTCTYAQIDPDDTVAGDEKFVLVVCTDTMGRDIRFRYFAKTLQGTGFEGKTVVTTATEKVGLVAEVADFRREIHTPDEPRTNATPLGRVWKFDYYVAADAGGNARDLKSITTPPVGGTPNGNDFPLGKTTVMTYRKITDAEILADARKERLRSNLISITYPNEVAVSGPPRVTIEYDETLGNEALFDRVKKYSLGGTNTSGVKAGGEILYAYTELAPDAAQSTANLMNSPKLQVAVTDRNGNQTTYQYSGFGPILRKEEFTRGLRIGEPASFVTTYAFNEDKQVTKTTFPEGNFIDYVYDREKTDRHQQGNAIRSIMTADLVRGGDQKKITWTTCCAGENAYEPIFGQLHRVIDPRGTDPEFVPPIADPAGRDPHDRYTTVSFFDYQEDDATQVVGTQTFFASAVRLTGKRGLNPASATDVQSTVDLLNANGIKLGLGDLNGDGKKTDRANGNVIRAISPSVVLTTEGAIEAQQIAIEALVDAGDVVDQTKALSDGGPGEGTDPNVSKKLQTLVRMMRYNNFGQMTSMGDEEGNVHTYEYFAENDPDGDGLTTGSLNAPPGPADGRSLVSTPTDFTNPATGGGYLKKPTRDSATDPEKTPSTVLLAVRDNNTAPTAVAIPTLYQYEDCGDTIGVIDGRGIRTDFFVNELDQVVETTRAAAVGLITPDPVEPITLTAFAFKSRTAFDFNDNVVFSQVEDRGNTSSTDGNLASGDIPAVAGDPDPVGGTAFVDTSYKFDILDNRVETVQEVTNGVSLKILRSKARYDRNENLVASLAPAGTAVRTRFDERDLVFSRTRGFVGTLDDTFAGGQLPTGATFAISDARGGIASVTFSHYDRNRNLIETVDAEDSDSSPLNNSDIFGIGDRTRYIYDGFDRLASIIDSVGNQVVYQYDPAGNRIRELHFGPNGGPSPTSDGPDTLARPVSTGIAGVATVQTVNLVNTNLLAATEYKFDESNRLFETNRALFVASGLSPVRTPDVDDDDPSRPTISTTDTQAIPGVSSVTLKGRVTARAEYDRKSRSTFSIEDDMNVYRTDYDGADRSVKSTDPEGNLVQTAYDDNSNAIEVLETDKSQLTGATETFRTTSFYDALNRLQTGVFNVIDPVADATAQADDFRYDSRGNLVAHADAQGPVTTRTINRRGLGSSAAVVINDFGNVSIFFFDGISRQLKTEQILTASGDGDGTNIGATLEGVKTTTPTPDTAEGGGDGKIRVGYVWDDNSLLQALLDDQGNVTCYLYDNLNRRIVETKGLTTFNTAGTFTRTNFFVPSTPPPGPPATERKVFTPTVPTQDAPADIPNALIDAQIAQVKAGVDAVATDFPSIADRRDEIPPTSIIYGYDRDDNVLILEDENDSEVFSRFDGISRRIAVRVFRAGQTDSHAGDPTFAPAPSAAFLDRRNPAQYNQQTDPVVGTHKNDSEFDGLSRLTRATDNNEPGDSSDDSEVKLFYDSLSHLFEENQKLGTGPTHVVSSGWRADDLRPSLVYPSSGSMQRKVLHTFDSLDRLKDVKDDGASTPIATYSYIGKWRVEKRAMQNGVDLTVPYDGVRRPRRWEHKQGTTLKIGFGYEFASGKPAYNRTNNKLIEEKLHDPVNSESYAYDSVYRLGKPGTGNGFERGTLNGTKTAIATLTTTPGVLQTEDWNLDGVGNWSDETFQFQGGASTTDDRSHTSINEFHQSVIGATTLGITHDDNGNVLDDDTKAHAHIGKPKLRRKWDYRNRMREVVNKDTAAQLGVYTYDALDRRAKKNAGGTITVFLLDGNREIQERNGSGVITQEYPFGVYIDEPLALDRNLNGDDTAIGAGDQRLIYHQNTIYSVFALTDTTGGVVEGYLYDAYGRPYVITDGDDADSYVNFEGNDVVTNAGASSVARAFLFTARRIDDEVYGQYFYRARYYDWDQARFLGRDKRQRTEGLYAFCFSRPTSLGDPFGETPSGFEIPLEEGGGKGRGDYAFVEPDLELPEISIRDRNGFEIDRFKKTSRGTWERQSTHGGRTVEHVWSGRRQERVTQWVSEAGQLVDDYMAKKAAGTANRGALKRGLRAISLGRLLVAIGAVTAAMDIKASAECEECGRLKDEVTVTIANWRNGKGESEMNVKLAMIEYVYCVFGRSGTEAAKLAELTIMRADLAAPIQAGETDEPGSEKPEKGKSHEEKAEGEKRE